MQNAIESVVSVAPAQQTTSRFRLLDAVVNTRAGLSCTTAVAVALISISCEPAFLLVRGDDPIEEPRLSYTRTAVVTVAAALFVLLFPIGAQNTRVTSSVLMPQK